MRGEERKGKRGVKKGGRVGRKGGKGGRVKRVELRATIYSRFWILLI